MNTAAPSYLPTTVVRSFVGQQSAEDLVLELIKAHARPT